jgi:hypothetical protein
MLHAWLMATSPHMYDLCQVLVMAWCDALLPLCTAPVPPLCCSRASELSRVRGTLSCLMINDLDAGIGHFENTQVGALHSLRGGAATHPPRAARRLLLARQLTIHDHSLRFTAHSQHCLYYRSR